MSDLNYPKSLNFLCRDRPRYATSEVRRRQTEYDAAVGNRKT